MRRSRVMIAGTNSGCGNTTVTCAVMRAFLDRGLRVAPFKCGPDYIAPMIHRQVTGRASVNLDSFFTDKEMLNWLFNSHLTDCDIAVVEGDRGLYDGIGTGTKGSSFEIALATKTPVILVVDGRGMALSLAAVIRGYKNFTLTKQIKGVIINRVSRETYLFLKETLEKQTGLPMLGYLEPLAAWNAGDLDREIAMLGAAARETIDLEAIAAIADDADEGKGFVIERKLFETSLAAAAAKTPVKLAVAMDSAFCFYYEDNLDLFRRIGVTIVPFSPLAGDAVPDDADGIYLGDGHPEDYAAELERQLWPKLSLRHCLSMRMPMIAECGGFVYMHETMEDRDGHVYKMAGMIPGHVKLADRTEPSGYVRITVKNDGPLGPAGTVIRGHEMRCSESDNAGEDLLIERPDGASWSTGFYEDFFYGGYPHLYLFSNLKSAMAFQQAMIRFHKSRQERR